jgi:two-component system cell cycle sensor histidine kinase/response regulator CckA
MATVLVVDDVHRQGGYRVLDLRPETRVVYISGFAEALIADDGTALEPGRVVVAKSFTGAQPREAIAAELTAVR